jgi:acyl-CoA thioesterase
MYIDPEVPVPEIIDRLQDPIKYAVEVIGGDPFASLLGIKIEEARNLYARASLVIKEEYCNANVRTHGGVLFTLADQTFAVAVHASGLTAFAMEVKINYFQATHPGQTVYAESTPINIRNRVSLWNVDLTDDNGDRIAFAQGLAYHFQDPGQSR